MTEDQKVKIAEIDKKYTEKTQELQKSYMQVLDAYQKLMNDPNSSDEEICKRIHELGSIQADFRFTQVLVQREKNRLYTPEQRAILAKGSGSSGGCGSGCGSGSNSAKPTKTETATTSGGCGSCGGG